MDEVAARVVDAAGVARRKLGVGLPERYDGRGLEVELSKRGLAFAREVPFRIRYDEEVLGEVRADFVVEGAVLMELKAVETLLPHHAAQVLTYLRASGLPLALLVNFHAVPFGTGIRRFGGAYLDRP